MSPDKALDLVRRVSSLQWEIRAAKARIGRGLDKCQGLKGKRHEKDGWRGYTQAAQDDQDTHLKHWYMPEKLDEGGRDYIEIGDDEREECPHCYAAHLIVQERKAVRKAFGCVKAAMTKTTPKPAILKECYEPDGF